MQDVVTKVGKKKGSTSVIMAGVHGNEICGIKAFDKIIPKLKIEKGTVHFLIGNPLALKENKRFIEYNLNRLFTYNRIEPRKIQKTYEYSRAQYIKKFLNKSNALLDIHSTTNKSTPFIVCEKNANALVRSFPADFKKIVYGFDKLESGGSDGYMIAQRKIGICAECGQHTDKSSIIVASKVIKAFLQKRGHIRSKTVFPAIRRQTIKVDLMYKTKSNSFILAKSFKDFDPIKKNEVVGMDGKSVVLAKHDGFILFAHNSINKGSEGFILARKV